MKRKLMWSPLLAGFKGGHIAPYRHSLSKNINPFDVICEIRETRSSNLGLNQRHVNFSSVCSKIYKINFMCSVRTDLNFNVKKLCRCVPIQTKIVNLICSCTTNLLHEIQCNTEHKCCLYILKIHALHHYEQLKHNQMI